MTGVRWMYALDWHARTDRIVVLTSDDNGLWTIWSIAPDGQGQIGLRTGKEPIRAMCTSPVSDVVYALRERGRTSDILRIPMLADAGDATALVTGLPVTGDSFLNSFRCTVSRDGRQLLYLRATTSANLWRLDLARPTNEAERLTQGTLQFTYPDVSPDGQWIAAMEGPETDAQLIKIPVAGGEFVRLGEGALPVWSPDGGRLAFVSSRSGSRRVWLTRADVEWSEEVKDSAVGSQPPIWLPDGRLAWATTDHGNYRIRDPKPGRDEFLVREGAAGYVNHPRFSPNGDQVVVLWNRPKIRPQYLVLLSWPGRDEHPLAPASANPAIGPWAPIGWSADGEWFYATTTGRTIVRVSARTGKTERAGEFPMGTLAGCDLTPDRASVICSLVEEKADAWLMKDFDPEISSATQASRAH